MLPIVTAGGVLIVVRLLWRERQTIPPGPPMPASVIDASPAMPDYYKLPPNVPAHMRSTKVYPDELVYQGDAYGFVYVPRSLQLGIERYQSDLRRVLGEASTQRVQWRPHPRGASTQ